MKVILGMVQTANGIIAKKDFSEDFLSEEDWKLWKNLAEEIGCFVVGRKTYKLVSKWEGENFDNVKAKKIFLSKNKKLKLNSNFILANSPKEVLKIASDLGFTKILVSGGSKVNSSFMKEKLINEIILIIEPYILGKGIPLFEESEFENKLKLLNIKKFRSGIIQLYYKIIK